MRDSNPDIRSTVQPRSALWGAPAVILLTFLVVGCYTILKHPITAEEGPDKSAYHQEFYREQCVNCHADYAEYPYGFFYGDYPEYYFEYPRFGYYYAYPWWWDRYWYHEGEGAEAVDESGNPIEPSARASRRGSLAPPYVVGAPALPTGSGYRAPTTVPVKGGTDTGTGTTGPTPVGEKTRVKKADEPADSQQGDNQSTESDKKGKASRRGGIDP